MMSSWLPTHHCDCSLSSFKKAGDSLATATSSSFSSSFVTSKTTVVSTTSDGFFCSSSNTSPSIPSTVSKAGLSMAFMSASSSCSSISRRIEFACSAICAISSGCSSSSAANSGPSRSSSSFTKAFTTTSSSSREALAPPSLCAPPTTGLVIPHSCFSTARRRLRPWGGPPCSEVAEGGGIVSGLAPALGSGFVFFATGMPSSPSSSLSVLSLPCFDP
mmetsp:Transcript_24944/g.45389  ORF Transcript_24944/g.45389 Transcript_24944/m.45389 type:complete len:218 (+) Transcript_24944:546-1199(+)